MPQLLARRLATDPASPLITFYDDATGERVELSAITFDNWVAKTANLLVDGLGLGPGDTAGVVLPLHWQTFAIFAGCWAAGIHVVTHPTGDEAVAVTAEGWTPPAASTSAGATAPETLLVSLRPLGQGLLQAAAPGTTDYATDVRAYGDRFVGPAVSPDAPALDGRSHADLVRDAEQIAERNHRVLFAPDGDPACDVTFAVEAYVAPLTSGSVVLCRRADRDALPRRLAAEQAILR